MLRKLIPMILIVTLVVVAITSTRTADANGGKKEMLSQQVLRNTMRAFGEIDGKRITSAQVNHYMGLPRCPNVDESRALITEGEWLYIDSTATVGIAFHNAHVKGTKVFEVTK